MIRGSLSHLDLTARDPARSIPFYDALLRHLGYKGAPQSAEDPAVPCWLIADADKGFLSIALKPAKPESARKKHDRYAPGLHHVAFHANDRADVDSPYELVQQIGAEILDPPAQYQYTPGYYAVFFADPDGLKLGFVFEPALRGRVK